MTETVPSSEPALSPYTRCYCEENVYALLLSRVTKDSRNTQQTMHSLESSSRRHYAVFVSNETRSCLLFQQRASSQGPHFGNPVVWDYHVFAVSAITTPASRAIDRQRQPERRRHSDDSLALTLAQSQCTAADVTITTTVTDQDSALLGHPLLSEYVHETFRPDLFERQVLSTDLQSCFRIVPAQAYLDNFASDRSHMLRQRSDCSTELEYVHPPPVHDPICGRLARERGETNNLWTRFLDMRTGDEQARDAERYGVVVESVRELLEFDW
ncbi:hypothetical protein ACM66B_004778 [Microbotryomycetes sp. NB124-2]